MCDAREKASILSLNLSDAFFFFRQLQIVFHHALYQLGKGNFPFPSKRGFRFCRVSKKNLHLCRAEEFRIPYEVCPLDERFRIVKEDYYGENGGVVFPNPNAPTGLFMGLEDVEDIIRHNQDAVVIVDEAYVDFGAESAMPLTEKYENLLVVQTFSKSRSMAGMRIGFAVGSPKLIRYLEDVKYSFNSYTMSRLALRCGAEAVRDRAYFEDTSTRIRERRERAKKILGEMGFVCTDSMANFLFAAHPEHRAADLFQALKEAGIYVRYFAKPRIDDYLRITVGTDQQMEVLYGFLRNYLSHRGK